MKLCQWGLGRFAAATADFTAAGSWLGEYKLTVLSDCCAAESDHDYDEALSQLQRFLRVRVCRSDSGFTPM